MDSILMVFWPKGVTVQPRLVKMGRKLLDDGEIPGVQVQHHRIEQMLGRHGGLPVGPQPFKNDALPRSLGMHQHQAFRRLEQGELLVQSPRYLKSAERSFSVLLSVPGAASGREHALS